MPPVVPVAAKSPQSTKISIPETPSQPPVGQQALKNKAPENKVIEVSAEPVQQIVTQRQAADSLNWSSLAFDLDLQGLARQLAMNCIVKSYADNHLQLNYLPELEVMLKPDVESQIKQAIQDKLGVSLTLEFSSTASLNVETPQEADVRKQEQHRQTVIQAIKLDPVVVELNKYFAAELIEDSVQKKL